MSCLLSPALLSASAPSLLLCFCLCSVSVALISCSSQFFLLLFSPWVNYRQKGQLDIIQRVVAAEEAAWTSQGLLSCLGLFVDRVSGAGSGCRGTGNHDTGGHNAGSITY